MQTCTLFPSTDLYFTNAFVAIVDDFHHSSLKKKNPKKQISVTLPIFSLVQKTGNYKLTNVCPFGEIFFFFFSNEEVKKPVPERWQMAFRAHRKLASVALVKRDVCGCRNTAPPASCQQWSSSEGKMLAWAPFSTTDAIWSLPFHIFPESPSNPVSCHR